MCVFACVCEGGRAERTSVLPLTFLTCMSVGMETKRVRCKVLAEEIDRQRPRR